MWAEWVESRKLVHATIFCPPLYRISGWYKQPYEAEILSVLLQVQAVKLCGFKTSVLFPRTLIKRNIQFNSMVTSTQTIYFTAGLVRKA